jgi:hypothetical protein
MSMSLINSPDWMVAGNMTTGKQSVAVFENILANASAIDTGSVNLRMLGCLVANLFSFRFIVLQHDLYEITVDLAIGYTLNAALNHNPAFTVSSLIDRNVNVSQSISARAYRQVHQTPREQLVLRVDDEQNIPIYQPD